MHPDPTPPPSRPGFLARNAITLKLLAIAVLLGLLLIPTNLVENLIAEREATSFGAARAISDQWGGSQLVLGPVLVLPYSAREQDEKGRVSTQTHYVCVLPDTLAATSALAPERRHRGIYETVVYRARLHVQGRFQVPPLADLGVPARAVHWSEAFVALGISDLKGVRNSVALRWDGRPLPFEPGLPNDEVLPVGSPYGLGVEAGASVADAYPGNHEVATRIEVSSGLNALVPLPDSVALTKSHPFAFDLDLNGSSDLLLAPLGRQTTWHLQAPWPNPSFVGAFLPAQRTITAQGFVADWRVLHLNRNFPQHWRTRDTRPSVEAATFGVNLLVPVDEYQKTMRAAKYAVLPLALTFLVFFFVEVLARRRIHPFQYLLVGLALVIFYVLLLALAEQMPFDAAYGVAALVIVGLVTAYAAASLRQRRPALITAGVLSLVYGFLFVVLQLEDYALLVGSLGLVVVLATVMFLSRNIDWYNPVEE